MNATKLQELILSYQNDEITYDVLKTSLKELNPKSVNDTFKENFGFPSFMLPVNMQEIAAHLCGTNLGFALDYVMMGGKDRLNDFLCNIQFNTINSVPLIISVLERNTPE